MTGLSIFTLIGGGQALFGPSLPAFSQHYELQEFEVGLILSTFWAGALIGVLGSMVRWLSHFMRWRAGMGIACISLGAGLIAIEYSWGVVLLGAVIFGIGYGLQTVGLNGLFASAFGLQSPQLVNMLNALFGVGAIVAPAVYVVLGQDPAKAFLLVSVVGALLVPFAVMVDDRVRPTTQETHKLFLLVRGYFWFLVLMGLGVGVEASAVGWGATILVGNGLGSGDASFLTSMFYLCFTVTRFVAIGLALHVRAEQLVLWGTGVTGLMFGGAALMPEFSPYGYALGGGAVALVFPNVFSWLSPVLKIAPEMSGLIVCAGMLGGIVCPALLAQMIVAFGTESAFWSLCLMGVIGTVISLHLMRPTTKALLWTH